MRSKSARVGLTRRTGEEVPDQPAARADLSGPLAPDERPGSRRANPRLRHGARRAWLRLRRRKRAEVSRQRRGKNPADVENRRPSPSERSAEVAGLARRGPRMLLALFGNREFPQIQAPLKRAGGGRGITDPRTWNWVGGIKVCCCNDPGLYHPRAVQKMISEGGRPPLLPRCHRRSTSTTAC